MAVYAGGEQSLNASGPGGHCIDLIPLAALVTVDLMSLPTQRTDRVCLPPLPVTACVCDPFKLSSRILTPRNGTLDGTSDEEPLRKEVSFRKLASTRPPPPASGECLCSLLVMGLWICFCLHHDVCEFVFVCATMPPGLPWMLWDTGLHFFITRCAHLKTCGSLSPTVSELQPVGLQTVHG